MLSFDFFFGGLEDFFLLQKGRLLVSSQIFLHATSPQGGIQEASWPDAEPQLAPLMLSMWRSRGSTLILSQMMKLVTLSLNLSPATWRRQTNLFPSVTIHSSGPLERVTGWTSNLRASPSGSAPPQPGVGTLLFLS